MGHFGHAPESSHVPVRSKAIVGSLNFDLVFRAARRPLRGETLPGHSFNMFLGGKGFNQAVAAGGWARK